MIATNFLQKQFEKHQNIVRSQIIIILIHQIFISQWNISKILRKINQSPKFDNSHKMKSIQSQISTFEKRFANNDKS